MCVCDYKCGLPLGLGPGPMGPGRPAQAGNKNKSCAPDNFPPANHIERWRSHMQNQVMCSGQRFLFLCLICILHKHTESIHNFL